MNFHLYKEIDELREEVDNLKARIRTLETMNQHLREKLEAQTAVTDYLESELDPDCYKGW